MDYLEWAIRHYGSVRFNLASSGVRSVPAQERAAIVAGAPPMGLADLARAIADHHGFDPGEVMPTMGASHAIWLAAQALAGPGDEVLVEKPTYAPLRDAIRATGASVRRFARSWAEGFTLDPQQVRSVLTPQTRLVVVTNLHNPSGIRATDDALLAVAAMLAAQDGMLLVDEVYASFDPTTNDRGRFLGSARHLAPNIVAISSASKSLGLGPARIGWLLAPQLVVERTARTMVATLCEFPDRWIAESCALLGEASALTERARAWVGDKRGRVERWFTERPALAWSKPAAGLYGIAAIPGTTALRPLVEAGMHEREVIVAPGEFFEMPGHVRLAWGLPDALLDEALARWGEVLNGRAA